MQRYLRTTGALLLAIALLVGLWKLNIIFGRRTGEIDHGRWYLIEGKSGTRYYMKGIDPGNQFLDREEAQGMIKKRPGYVRTEQGFGAAWTQRGLLNDAYLNSSGWKLFDTEADAIDFLKENGVEKQNIYFVYK